MISFMILSAELSLSHNIFLVLSRVVDMRLNLWAIPTIFSEQLLVCYLPVEHVLQLDELQVVQLELPLPPLICTVVKIWEIEPLLHFGHFTLLLPEILVNSSNALPHFLHLNSYVGIHHYTAEGARVNIEDAIS